MTSIVFLPALPEIFLAGAALLLLLIGVLGAPRTTGRTITWFAVLALAATAALILEAPAGRELAFSGLYQTDSFAVFVKLLILGAAGAALLAGLAYNEWQKIDRFEFPVLALLSVSGMLTMVSANDLISLYIGLELQSLALYVLAAFKRDDARSAEAGLKYFVLGALSSGLLLFGASLLYGFSGGTNFEMIGAALLRPEAVAAAGAVIGLAFVVAGLAFKCSAVPFHMWTPDVYEGSPTSVTAFFSVAPKVAALALLVRVVVGPLAGLTVASHHIIWILSAASMILGGYAALRQTNIKRLLAYSSIGHIGYALMGLAAGTEEGIRGLLLYIGIYLFMSTGVFAILLGLGRAGKPVELISDLAGLGRTRPATALGLTAFLISMAGIPPAAGIFGKIFVFLPALHAGLYGLAILGVLTSVVACFYYLRIVKVLYTDESVADLDPGFVSGEQKFVAIVAAVFVIFFCVDPSPLIDAAGIAAHSLFP